jgi:hypothetical protein
VQQEDRPFPLPAAGQFSAHPHVAAPFLHGQVDEGDDDGGVGAEEGQVAVRGGPLGAVGVQVDLRQGVYEAPNAGAEEVAEGLRDHPRQGVAALEFVMTGIEHGMHHHGHQGDGFQGGEEATDGKPVSRRADPEVVVTQAEEVAADRQAAGGQLHGVLSKTRLSAGISH